MKVALAQLNYHIGNFKGNTSKIVDYIGRAREMGADLVVFGELAICGYPPRDFLEFQDFIAESDAAIEEVAKACIGISALVGGPSVNPKVEGKDLFNSAYFLSEGKIETIRHKGLLPNYDVFDEYRYFEPSRDFQCIELKGEKVAVTICEDIWDVDENLMYTISPMDELIKEKPSFMVNLSASPFTYQQREARLHVLEKNTKKYGIPALYINHVGAQTELIFDGGSMVFDSNGEIVQELPYFKEDIRLIDTQQLRLSKQVSPIMPKIERIHNALVTGIRDYFRKLGFKDAVVGLSGGIDSAVTFALACEALGTEHVKGILMPSSFSSDHSIADAEQLANNYGSGYSSLSIEEVFGSVNETLKPLFEGMPFGLAEENIQARIRGLFLMAISNKFGNILLNTSNKSEAAVGYGTLYGDMCGGLAVIGDVYKTEVYELARFINRNGELIPINSITKPPSAELRPDQKDSDSLPEYDELDPVLHLYIEQRKGPKEIIALGHDEKLVRSILKLVNANEYKRHQTPPTLRVSPKAFGMGRRVPIVGKYLS